MAAIRLYQKFRISWMDYSSLGCDRARRLQNAKTDSLILVIYRVNWSGDKFARTEQMNRFLLFLVTAVNLIFCLSFFLVVRAYSPDWLGVV